MDPALSKSEIARRQLGAALYLFINDMDPVSVHALACGGGEISEHLSKKAGREPISTHILATFSDLNMNQLVAMRNKYWNSFKHAKDRKGFERKDMEVVADFNDQVNDHVLFLGWYDYMQASAGLPIEVQIFQVWYYAMYPEKIAGQPAVDFAIELFGRIATVARSESKRRLRIVIDDRRSDIELMTHPQTEKRPLLIGGLDMDAEPSRVRG